MSAHDEVESDSKGRRRSRRRAPAAPVAEPSEWQALFLADLNGLEDEYGAVLSVLQDVVLREGNLYVKISLATTELDRVPGTPRLLPREEFTLVVPEHDGRPPHVTVDHERFLGAAHVMSCYELCLYLDIAREWDPDDGARGVLNRLWRWLEDTAGGRFETDTALYHAVGGVLHLTEGTPTIVVRDLEVHGPRAFPTYLRQRTPHRFDLVSERSDADDVHVPVIPLRRDLPVGAGGDVLGELLGRIEATQGLVDYGAPTEQQWAAGRHLFRSPHVRQASDLGSEAVSEHRRAPRCLAALSWPAPAVQVARFAPPQGPVTRLVEALVDSVKENPAGTPQYAILAVPHPHGGSRHLLCLRLAVEVADALRRAAREPGKRIDLDKVIGGSPNMPIAWCRVSDERREVTTRRDFSRPVSALLGKTVHLWGVGGLGSWIAEYVVRAGAARVVLHDPGVVTGGLLVRQDFEEEDIGNEKAQALALRLRSLRDDVTVEVLDTSKADWAAQLAGADLVIDATISRVVNRVLDAVAATRDRRAVIAQVATDAGTGTLGMATVSCPPARENSPAAPEAPGFPALSAIDVAAGVFVRGDSTLEAYRTFWVEPVSGQEFVPTRGCSLPTFHGSAADMAGVASALLNFVCLHINAPNSGTHLFAMPISMVTPAHVFISAVQEGLVRPELRVVVQPPEDDTGEVPASA